MMASLPSPRRRLAHVGAILLAVGLGGAGFACNMSEQAAPPPPDEQSEAPERHDERRTQKLGESTNAYRFDGESSRSIPGYNGRLARHLMNRFRTDPAEYGIQTMRGPVPPKRPLVADPGLVEAGRWQAEHALEAQCFCPQLQPQPMQMGQGGCCLPDSAEKNCEITTQQQCDNKNGTFKAGSGCGTAGCPNFPQKNSCCQIEKKNGKVACKNVSTDIKCGDEQNATDQDKRWAYLATGSAEISNELYQSTTLPPEDATPSLPGSLLACWAVGACSPPTLALRPPQPFLRNGTNAMGVAQAKRPKVPDKCKPPMDTCQVGTCTNLETGANVCDESNNPSCSGVCKGEACDGVCRETNADTGVKEPVDCTLPKPPDPEECKPEKYTKEYYVSYVHGLTQEPIPTLVDGIHYRLGLYAVVQGQPVFSPTSAGQIGFGIHYYDPVGDAQNAEVVIDGNCNGMSVEKRNMGEVMNQLRHRTDSGLGKIDAIQPPGDTSTTDSSDGATVTKDSIIVRDSSTSDSSIGTDGSGFDTSGFDTSGFDTSGLDTSSSDAPGFDTSGSDTSPVSDTAGSDADAGGQSKYLGLRYGTEVNLSTGCHRYVFVFEDADGFTHTYPRYGSLGAKIDTIQTENGSVKAPVPNDENCPIWSPERPDQSCLPKGDQCVSGETRQCYSGRENTRGAGVCKLGTESCKNGRWSGVCKNEVTPKPDDICGDGKDNDCNGYVDEGCESGGDTGDGDVGDTGAGPDAVGSDTGDAIDGGGDTGETPDDGCACGTPGEGLPATPVALLAAFGLVALRRRRKQ